jgi:hypothetical protein
MKKANNYVSDDIISTTKIAIEFAKLLKKKLRNLLKW